MEFTRITVTCASITAVNVCLGEEEDEVSSISALDVVQRAISHSWTCEGVVNVLVG